ncbi:MAG TPA: chain length determinant protein EpsF [Burkholderiales bacterium]|nr:chain length determinant protein EpsF [Burkholderiales bacterium]
MNLELFISALRARMTVFVSVLLATVLAAAVVSLLLPKTYRATTLLVADAKDEQSLSNVLRPLMVPQERMNYMQTQIDVITSPRVARKVVQDLNLAENPMRLAEFRKDTGGAGSIEDWLGQDLLRRLKVETSQSSIVQVSYSSRDAEFSATVANAFAKAYLETVLELRVEPTRQAALWFDEQLKSLRANLENAQIKLTDYHRKQGIVSADERLDVENARLGELSSQLVKAQDQTFDWKTRVQEARAALKRGGSLDKLPDVVNNPYIQKLNSELLLGEAKLQQMAAEYGANYPAYQRQQSENRALRQRLDAEMKKIVAGMENSMRQSAQREAELKAAIAAQRAHLLEDKVNRNELALLTRNVETAQRTYETALQRAVVSQVDSRASQANVTVLNPAVVPGEPYRPRIALNIALSVAVGAMLGIALVILSELLDRRVRLSTDLDHGLEVPLLVVLGGQASAAPWLAGPATPGRGALPGPA